MKIELEDIYRQLDVIINQLKELTDALLEEEEDRPKEADLDVKRHPKD